MRNGTRPPRPSAVAELPAPLVKSESVGTVAREALDRGIMREQEQQREGEEKVADGAELSSPSPAAEEEGCPLLFSPLSWLGMVGTHWAALLGAYLMLQAHFRDSSLHDAARLHALELLRVPTRLIEYSALGGVADGPAVPPRWLPTPVEFLNVAGGHCFYMLLHVGTRQLLLRLIRWIQRYNRVVEWAGRALLLFFPQAQFQEAQATKHSDRVKAHSAAGADAGGGRFSFPSPRWSSRASIPLTLRFETEGVRHTLYGLEALVYRCSVFTLALCLALLAGTSRLSDDDRVCLVSTVYVATIVRIVTPLQSVSALFVADVGLAIGGAQAREMRSGLRSLEIGVRVALWFVAGVFIAVALGSDPWMTFSSLGAGSLLVGLALRETLEDGLAIINLSLSAPFHIGDTVTFGDRTILGSVERLGFRCTHIRCKFDGNLVQVPNIQLAKVSTVTSSDQ